MDALGWTGVLLGAAAGMALGMGLLVTVVVVALRERPRVGDLPDVDPPAPPGTPRFDRGSPARYNRSN